MLSLSQRILICEALAAQDCYSPKQIAEMVGETPEWVTQIIAARRKEPLSLARAEPRVTHAYDTEDMRKRAVSIPTVRTNMVYDSRGTRFGG